VGDAGSQPILVANPDEQVREVVARVVEAGGHEVVRLEPAADVTAAVVSSSAAGLVLDLGAANLAALQALRAEGSAAATDVRVVVIGTGPAGGRLAWQAGADGFLVRPFHARDLQAAVAEALAADDGARQARRTAGAQAVPT
jgi:DNA-binding NtrC family response regulator